MRFALLGRERAPRPSQALDADIPRIYSTIEISVWQEKSAAEKFALGLGSLGRRYGFVGIRREGIGSRGWVVEGEILGFVVLDGAEEGVVVGGAFGGDFP